MKRANYKFAENSFDNLSTPTCSHLQDQSNSFSLSKKVNKLQSEFVLPSNVLTSRSILSPNCCVDRHIVHHNEDYNVSSSSSHWIKPKTNLQNANRINYCSLTSEVVPITHNDRMHYKCSFDEISIPSKQKKKNLIHAIRKKINNVLENCSSKNFSPNSKHFKKCRSLEVLSNNFLECKSDSLSKESLSKNRDIHNPSSQSYGKKHVNCTICLPESFIKLSPINKDDIVFEKLLEKSGTQVSESDISASHPSCFCVQLKSSINPHNERQIPGDVPSASCRPILPHPQLVIETNGYKIDKEEDFLILKQSVVSGSPKILQQDNLELQNGVKVEKVVPSCIDKSENFVLLDLCPKPNIERSLTQELRELVKYGWYWGSMNRKEAEEKLIEEPDGAFLVRDSSDVKYLYTLSFKSYGKTYHTRIEHSNGWFSFYPQPDNDGHKSLVNLVEHCISESDAGVFCYSRPLLKGSPSFPVRLTKPISRFMKVRSLQYLCRFVIRRYMSISHIQNLPAPIKIKQFLEESYY